MLVNGRDVSQQHVGGLNEEPRGVAKVCLCCGIVKHLTDFQRRQEVELYVGWEGS